MSASLLFSLFSSCCVALILDTGQTLRLQVLLFLFGLVGFYVPFLVWYLLRPSLGGCGAIHKMKTIGYLQTSCSDSQQDSHIDGVRV